jgi:hypothetical protein
MKKPKKAQDPALPIDLEAAGADTLEADDPEADTAVEAAGGCAASAPAGAVWDDEDDEDEAPPPPLEASMTITLSRQLHGRLIRTAQEEGVTPAALAQELLAEGVTLRAWEIIERKSAMRGQSSPQPQAGGNGNGRPFGNGNGNGSNYRHGGRPGGPGNSGGNGNNRAGNPNRRQGAPNNAWMEDKAAFLEYVRNQEKRRR